MNLRGGTGPNTGRFLRRDVDALCAEGRSHATCFVVVREGCVAAMRLVPSPRCTPPTTPASCGQDFSWGPQWPPGQSSFWSTKQAKFAKKSKNEVAYLRIKMKTD